MKGDSIMEYLKKSGFAKTFSIWFGIGALMFGTYCGANMASGVYASAYIVTLGGGWSLVWLSIFFCLYDFFLLLSAWYLSAFTRLKIIINTTWRFTAYINQMPTRCLEAA